MPRAETGSRVLLDSPLLNDRAAYQQQRECWYGRQTQDSDGDNTAPTQTWTMISWSELGASLPGNEHAFLGINVADNNGSRKCLASESRIDTLRMSVFFKDRSGSLRSRHWTGAWIGLLFVPGGLVPIALAPWDRLETESCRRIHQASTIWWWMKTRPEIEKDLRLRLRG